TDDGHEYRVPYPLLSRALEAPRQHVQSRTDTLRAQWQAGDRVRFAVGTAVLHGTISRVNPRYAHVDCDDDREYRVPYARQASQPPRRCSASSPTRSAATPTRTRTPGGPHSAPSAGPDPAGTTYSTRPRTPTRPAMWRSR